MLKGRRRTGLTLALGGLLLAAGMTGSAGWDPSIGSGGVGFALLAPQNRIARAPLPAQGIPQDDFPPKLRAKQQKDLRKYRFEKLKDHAAELAKLSSELKEDLDKSNENILSLEIVDKAAKIEKLAKKIQGEAKMGR